MNLRELSLFVRVYEAGSFATVAQEAYLTRQAVSKAVAQLEAELGQLFLRESRGVRPTALARDIYPMARNMLQEHSAIIACSERFKAGTLGALSLACEPGAMLTLPPRLVELYREARPHVDLSLELLPTPVARRHLLDGRADAVVSGPLVADNATYLPLFSSSLAIVFSERAFLPQELEAGHPIEGGALTLGIESLQSKTVLGVAPENHVERSLLPYLAKRGIAVELTCDYGDSMLGQSEMLRGTGGIIVEEDAAWRQFDQPGMVLIPLIGSDAPQWMVGVTYLPGCPNEATVRDFAKYADNLVGRR